MDRRTLTYRVLTAVVGIPLLLGAAWLGGWWWASVTLAIAALGGGEYWRLLRPGDVGAAIALSLGISALWVWVHPWPVGIATAAFFAFGVLPPVVSGSPARAGWLATRWGSVVIGSAYLGVAAGVLAGWGFRREFSIMLWLFVVIWINDIAAYFVGHAVGRHKLAPLLSPGKSWEGAAAGLLAGVAAGAGLASWISLSPAAAAGAGAAVTAAAQLGDLFESAIKRRAGVKDSGTIFPGHGGVLDRFDGVFAAAPVAYLLLHWWAS